MPSSLAVVETAPGWMTTCGGVESLSAADGRVRFRRAGGDDLDARLDAMAADSFAVIPPSGPKTPPRSVH